MVSEPLGGVMTPLPPLICPRSAVTKYLAVCKSRNPTPLTPKTKQTSLKTAANSERTICRCSHPPSDYVHKCPNKTTLKDTCRNIRYYFQQRLTTKAGIWRPPAGGRSSRSCKSPSHRPRELPNNTHRVMETPSSETPFTRDHSFANTALHRDQHYKTLHAAANHTSTPNRPPATAQLRLRPAASQAAHPSPPPPAAEPRGAPVTPPAGEGGGASVRALLPGYDWSWKAAQQRI